MANIHELSTNRTITIRTQDDLSISNNRKLINKSCGSIQYIYVILIYTLTQPLWFHLTCFGNQHWWENTQHQIAVLMCLKFKQASKPPGAWTVVHHGRWVHPVDEILSYPASQVWSGWWSTYPLKVRQWEGWHPIYEMENKKIETTNQLSESAVFLRQSENSSHDIFWLVVFCCLDK